MTDRRQSGLIRSPRERVRTSMSSPFASRSVGRHYARGALGLLALVAAVVGAAAATPAALGLLIVTVVSWRGCPTCWVVGLIQTQERRACSDGSCAGSRA